jgi:hypothetical protein
MKKFLAPVLALALLMSCFIIPVSAETADLKLPFELIPPKTVSMSKVYDGDSTDINLSFSKEEDMVSFMQDMGEEDKKAEILNKLGVEDLAVNAQVDWALDDKTDWHHDTWWDDNEGTREFGMGYDKGGNIRTNEWDIVELWLNPQISEECWITRYAGNPEDPEDTRWNGEDYEGGVHRNGMKDVLKNSQYIVKHTDDGEAYITVDYNEHTLYARMRYFVTVWDTEGGVRYLFSDWSDAASYGKDGNQWKPYTEDEIPAPVISDGYMTGEEFNGYPIVNYKLTVPEDLAEKFTKISGFGGYARVYVEARIKGSNQWLERQGDSDPKSEMGFDVLALAGDGKPICKDTEIEFRTRYFVEQRMGYNTEVVSEFYSPYSNVLTVKADRDYMVDPQGNPDEQNPDDNPQPVNPEPPISSLNSGASKNQVTEFIIGLKTDSDPKGSTFGILSAKQKKAKSNLISITWNKVKGAKSYSIYANKCGKANPYNYLTSLSSTSYTQKNLKKGTYYKYLVAAFNGSGKLIATSKTLHITTSGGKYGNYKKVTTAAKKDKVTLKKKGKSFKLKAKAVPESKKRKVSVHRKMKYESSNTKIATVNASGKITAKKKGKCFVYAYAQSGAYKKIKVTVKK